MNYILCHKSIPVLNFEMDDDNMITAINEVFNEKHAPVGVLNNAVDSPQKALGDWWKHRTIPASRQNLAEALNILGVKSSLELLKKCHGLSLSDHYWIKGDNADGSRLDWKDINFFENPFSEAIGKILVGNISDESLGDIVILTPDSSTDGCLKKKWIINESGARVLLKGGSETFQQEPFNEVITSEICSRLGIDHVDYSLTHQNKETGKEFFSVCPDFVSTESELVPAIRIFETEKQNNNVSHLSRIFSGCEKLGMKNLDRIKENLSKMFTLDFLIANTDRHFNNFGFLRNPDTLEWIGLAPVYDSGTSLFCKLSDYDLRNPAKHDSRYIETKPLAKYLDKQWDKAFRDTATVPLDLSALNGIGNKFADLLEANPQNSGRSALLGRILDMRVLETERELDKKIQKRTGKTFASPSVQTMEPKEPARPLQDTKDIPADKSFFMFNDNPDTRQIGNEFLDAFAKAAQHTDLPVTITFNYMLAGSYRAKILKPEYGDTEKREKALNKFLEGIGVTDKLFAETDPAVMRKNIMSLHEAADMRAKDLAHKKEIGSRKQKILSAAVSETPNVEINNRKVLLHLREAHLAGAAEEPTTDIKRNTKKIQKDYIHGTEKSIYEK